MRSLSLTDVVLCGVFAALTFAAAFTLGGAITAAFGPGMSGIATIIVTTVVVVVGAKIVDKFGAMVIMVTVFSVLAIPTTMFGPPGFQKIAVGLGTGIVYDIVISASGRRNWGYTLAGGVGALLAIFEIWGLLALLKLPGADKIGALVAFIAPLYFALGLVGGYLGVWLFSRSLKDLAIVRNLQGMSRRAEAGSHDEGE